jgi:hypothetical protein
VCFITPPIATESSPSFSATWIGRPDPNPNSTPVPHIPAGIDSSIWDSVTVSYEPTASISARTTSSMDWNPHVDDPKDGGHVTVEKTQPTPGVGPTDDGRSIILADKQQPMNNGWQKWVLGGILAAVAAVGAGVLWIVRHPKTPPTEPIAAEGPSLGSLVETPTDMGRNVVRFEPGANYQPGVGPTEMSSGTLTGPDHTMWQRP